MAKKETETKIVVKKAPETLEELRARPYPHNIITYFEKRIAALEAKLKK